jgi:hypothetical protein
MLISGDSSVVLPQRPAFGRRLGCTGVVGLGLPGVDFDWPVRGVTLNEQNGSLLPLRFIAMRGP